MIILLSPAKRLNVQNINIETFSKPFFISKSAELINILRKKSVRDIKNLMGLSNNLSELNFNRFQNWNKYHNVNDSYPAISLFYGDAYKTLNAQTLTNKDLNFLNNKLIILSGLYGILRPFDLIQEHRLEMGTKLENPAGKTLYDFWKKDITEQLNDIVANEKNKIIINLASNEYFNAIDKKILEYPVLNIKFKVEKNGKYQTVAIFAKKARGLMTRFIAENNIDNIIDLQAFDYSGYAYNESLSTEKEFVFILV